MKKKRLYFLHLLYFIFKKNKVYKTSSIFSGNFFPLVSGKTKAKVEAIEQHEPMTMTGNGFHNVAKISSKNPTIAPSPPKNDPIPTAEFLIGVGNSSAVHK